MSYAELKLIPKLLVELIAKEKLLVPKERVSSPVEGVAGVS